jgi:hypothetical protein
LAGTTFYYESYNSVNPEFTNKVKSIEITLSELDLEFLNKNYKNVYEGKFSEYRKNNKWYKSKISIDGTQYEGFVKLQGKSPAKNIKQFSLVVKINDPLYLGPKKFNLKTHKRVEYVQNNIFYKELPIFFKLIYQKLYPVKVTLNNIVFNYFYEERLKHYSLPKYQKYKLYSLTDGANKSLFLSSVLANLKDKKKFNTKMSSVLNNKIRTKNEKILKWHNKQKVDFSWLMRINDMIVQENFTELKRYFDIEYLKRFEALRLLAGFGTHGLMHHNSIWAISFQWKKIIPIFHRDFYFHSLEKRILLEKSIYQSKNLLVFYNMFSRSEYLRLKKYQFIANLIKENKYKKLLKKHSREDLLKNLDIVELEFSKNKVSVKELMSNRVSIEVSSIIPLKEITLCFNNEVSGINEDWKKNILKYQINNKCIRIFGEGLASSLSSSLIPRNTILRFQLNNNNKLLRVEYQNLLGDLRKI